MFLTDPTCDCVVCSGKTSFGDLISDVLRTVQHDRWGTIGVTSDPALTYTYGRTSLGRPELVIAGMIPHLAEEVIHAADHVHQLGLYNDVLVGHRVIAIPARIDRLNFARMVNPNAKALQIVWPDQEGRWPWDMHYSSANQPLLGETSALFQNP